MLAEALLCRGVLLLFALTGFSMAQSTVSVPRSPIGTAPPLPPGKPHVSTDLVLIMDVIVADYGSRILLRT